MPAYDFRCKDCGYLFAVTCRIDDRNKQTCPQCGSKNIEQRLTSINIGSGGACSSCNAGGPGFA